MRNSTKYLKQAETEAKRTNDNLLKSRICKNLAILNRHADEYSMALEYDKKALKYAWMAGDKEEELYCLNNISVDYGNLGQTNDAIFYMTKCIPLLQYIPKEDRAGLLAGLAAAYENVDLKKSKEYALQSIAIKPLDNAYHILAGIYLKENRPGMADSCWRKGLETSSDHKYKLTILWDMFCHHRNLRHDSLCTALSAEMMLLRDTIAIRQHQDSIKEIQMTHDALDDKRGITNTLNQLMYIIILATSILICIIVIACIIHKKYIRIIKSQEKEIKIQEDKINTWNKEIEHFTEEIKKEKQRIKRLENSGKDKQEKIAALKRDLKDMQAEYENSMRDRENYLRELMEKATRCFRN